ncbi:MAG: alkaline phosphatase family protein [Candidatus Hodarchaeales archaeon]
MPPKKKLPQNIFCFFSVDQWPYAAMEKQHIKQLAKKSGFTASIVKSIADYFPNITPVGHATLATGQNPKDHRILGRKWFLKTGEARAIKNILIYDPQRRHYTLNKSEFPHIFHKGFLDHFYDGVKNVLNNKPLIKIVVAAKDFVAYIFTGESYDVRIFPFEHDGKWSILCSVSERVKKKLPRAFWKKLIEDLSKEFAGRPEWQNYNIKFTHNIRTDRYDRGRQIRIGFNLKRKLGKDFRTVLNVEIDEMYKFLIKKFVIILQKHFHNFLIFTHCFATDWIGHHAEGGPTSLDYNTVLTQELRNIYTLLKELRTNGNRVLYSITSDHGGRHVKGITWWKYEAETNNRRWISGKFLLIRKDDVLELPCHDSNFSGALRSIDMLNYYRQASSGSQNHDIWVMSYPKLELEQLDSSLEEFTDPYEQTFSLETAPDSIIVPKAKTFIGDSESKHLEGMNGYHGCSYIVDHDTNTIKRNPLDFEVPLIIGAAPSLKNGRLGKIASIKHCDTRQIFINFIKDYSKEVELHE